ncbi:MAG: class I fructose-bisphosphate aldolase [Candidatus Pelagibacter sp.]
MTYQLGARFTKWRGVYIIADVFPSKLSNSQLTRTLLARYAALAQESWDGANCRA